MQVDSREAFVLPRKLLNDAARCFVQAPAVRAAPATLGATPGGAAAAGPLSPQGPGVKRSLSSKAPRLPDGSVPHLSAVPGGPLALGCMRPWAYSPAYAFCTHGAINYDATPSLRRSGNS